MSEVRNIPGEPTYRYTEDPKGTTRLLRILLWLSLGVVACSLVSEFVQLQLLNSTGIEMEKVAANLSRQAMIDETSWAVAFFTGIVFLLWIRYANINCHGFGALDMEYTPGWSIGWFFVPIANLFVPYFVMREIWKVSSNPVGWPRAKGNAVLGWWWVLSWISGFGGFIDPTFSSTGDLVTVLQRAASFDIALDALRIPALLMGIALISEISEKQDHLVRMGYPAPLEAD